MTITRGEGDTIVYTYTYAQDPGVAIDAAALKPTLVKGLKPVIDSTKGIFPDVKIQIIYLKPDNNDLDFPPSAWQKSLRLLHRYPDSFDCNATGEGKDEPISLCLLLPPVRFHKPAFHPSSRPADSSSGS